MGKHQTRKKYPLYHYQYSDLVFLLFQKFLEERTILKVVDLPAPFGPSNPNISPFLTEKLLSLIAT